MTYELAKELKEAGFKYDWCTDMAATPPTDCPSTCEQMGCYPTLSELIEACGEQFRYLIRDGEKSWRAWGIQGYELKHNYLTPEEAVARLWLALNKKV